MTSFSFGSVLLALLLSSVVLAAPGEIFVAANGKDAWSGTLAAPNAAQTDGPFASLHRAQAAARAARINDPKAQVSITLRGGTHFLPEPLLMGPEDNGVRWRSYPKETAIISGGVPIQGPWKSADGKLFTTQVPVGLDFKLLRVGDDWGVRARYPNFDPAEPYTGGWLFVKRCSKQEGNFGAAVGNIHNAGDFMEWSVDVPADGEYNVFHYYGAHNEPFGRTDMGGRMTFTVDGGEPVVLQILPDTGGWTACKWSPRNATLLLKAGKHTIRWTNTHGGGFNYDAFALCDDNAWTPSGAPPKAPAEGKHLLVVQAETFTKSQGKELTVAQPASRRHFGFDAKEMRPWPKSTEIEMHVFPAWGWVSSIEPVASFDHEQGVATLAGDANQELRVGNRYYLENIAEELDAVNEWYLDKGARTLSYLAPDPDFAKRGVVAGVLERLIHLKGASDVSFEGLTFMDMTYSQRMASPYYPMDAAIWIEDSKDCLIENCRFTRLGGSALNLVGEATGNRFLGNTVEHVGQNGVFMYGKEKTFPHGNIVAGCHLHHLGLLHKHVAGVSIGARDPSLAQAPGNLIAHNDIHDVPRYGIGIKMNQGNNVVEFNDIRNSNLETNDTGGVESCIRNENAAGNIYRYNLVMDAVGMGTTVDGTILRPHYTWGIYLDDHSSHAQIYGNICVRNVLGGVNIHGGRENLIENNILVDSVKAQLSLNNIGTSMVQNTVRRNIMYRLAPEGQMVQSNGFNDKVFAQVDQNLYWHANEKPALIYVGRPLEQWHELGYDTNSLIADPLFVDSASDDYRLKPDSPALKLGFKPIPVEKIGRKGYDRSQY
ncbi:MAG: right-handed parallel beta-helix repeat-containing protein [Armatimonadota bacterium]